MEQIFLLIETYPAVKNTLIIIGTLTTTLTITAPIISNAANYVASITETKKDDEILKKIAKSKTWYVVKTLSKQLKRFSLV